MGSEIEIYNCFAHQGGELEVEFKGNHVRVAFYKGDEEYEIEDCCGDHVDWSYLYQKKWLFLSGAALTSCEKKEARKYAISQFESWEDFVKFKEGK